MRKVFLDELPKWEKGGKAKEGSVNWKNAVGCNVRFIYDDIEDELNIIEYKNKKLIIAYKKQIFEINTQDFAKCRIAKILKKKTGEFKYEINQTFVDNKRNLMITDRKYIRDKSGINRKWYKYKCNKCGFECGEHYKKGEYVSDFWVEESNLTKGVGCPVCCHNPQIVVEGINDITTTNPELIKYFQGGHDEAKKYTFRSNSKIYPICPTCDTIKTKPITIDKIYGEGIGCSCDDGFSYGHKYIFSMLRQLNIQFKDNVRFDWCKYKLKNKDKQGEYDFVIEDIKTIIEVDGYFHRNNNEMNGQSREESRFIDNKKDELAIENGYNIIRLEYDHKDKNSLKDEVLNSKINQYFNLENIDWVKCNEYAMSSISKMIATYWNNKEEWETTTHVMNKFGLSRKTVSGYLKAWTELGYCNYDSEAESKKRYKRNAEINKERYGKPIEVFKDGKSFGVFKSVTEIDRQSIYLFGVKLDRRNISTVCTGKRKHHKGFTFKYVEDIA